MSESTILIIGAGAAGLLSARDLARAGRHVTVLEARDRTGGRIHTATPPGFSAPVELGAEFIHGEAPLTRVLLQEAGVRWADLGGEAYQHQDGRLQPAEEFIADMPRLLVALEELTEDLPLAEFLTRYFSGAGNATLREQVTRFAEGYDAADPARASSLALRAEWAAGGAEDSPRPVGGYQQLIDLLRRQALAAGAQLHLGTAVQTLHWQAGQVEARTADGRSFRARQALITVPLGVLQAAPNEPAALRFEPELPGVQRAAAALGFGPVIKVQLEFDAAFWEAEDAPALGNPAPGLGFLFADVPVPTWWTQLPDPRPLLTGWLGGPPAARLRGTPPEALLQLALESLAAVFGTTAAALRGRLRAHCVADWGADPWARGAYGYATVDAEAARRVLGTPVADTLYFAGEGLYTGPAAGTVEAALSSARAVLQQLM
jgi:monoamine oxidase